MKIEDARKVAALQKKHQTALEALWKLKGVKEFTKITIEGEDGAEKRSAVTFDGAEAAKLLKTAMDIARERVAEIEKEIEAL